MTHADPTLAARLALLFPGASGRSRKEWLREGRVLVNGRAVREGAAALRPDDRVTLAPRHRPFPAPLRLVHEDDAILVVEKPAGLLTIATGRERERTVYRLVWDYLERASPPSRPFIVHRLDRETSGLLVLAKTAEAKRRLQAQFADRSAHRVYLGVVEGTVPEERDTLQGRLAEDRSLRVRAVAGPAGKEAITRFRVLSRRRGTTLLELSLETGRRGQIRVQLAGMGHPIVGDLAHGARRGPGGRLCLHAAVLAFAHPSSGERVEFRSEAPFDRAQSRSPQPKARGR